MIFYVIFQTDCFKFGKIDVSGHDFEFAGSVFCLESVVVLLFEGIDELSVVYIVVNINGRGFEWLGLSECHDE